jgi:hypothetical protein
MRRAGIHSAGLWQLLALVVFLHMLPDWMLRCLVSAVRQPTKKKVWNQTTPSESLHDTGVAPVARVIKCNPPDTR